MRSAVVVIAAALLVACTEKKAPPVHESDAGGAASTSAPATSKRPTTTSWSIAGGNLDGDIESRSKADAPDPKSRFTLVQLLLARAQFTARIADVEHAEEIAERAVADHPKSHEALLARASVRNALHRWDEATRDLDAAEKLGASPVKLEATRGSIAMARGRYEDATKLVHEDARDANDIATAAVLAGLRQRHADAERLFEKARTTFRDVSPFPVAWMSFERARWLEARGEETKARFFYEEALETIPVYAHAAVHLAIGDAPDKAIARLEPLTKTSDDPDVLAALGDAHQRAKHEAEAKAWTDKARTRYEELLRRHPEAFADHAARFFLKVGDAKRALSLAEANAKNRETEEALDLLLGAATSANDKDAMCGAAKRTTALPWVSPERKRLADATLASCK